MCKSYLRGHVRTQKYNMQPSLQLQSFGVVARSFNFVKIRGKNRPDWHHWEHGLMRPRLVLAFIRIENPSMTIQKGLGERGKLYPLSNRKEEGLTVPTTWHESRFNELAYG